MVETDTVYVVPALEGLSTPSSSTLSWSPPATMSPLKIEHVTTSPDTVQPPPTWGCPDVVRSLTTPALVSWVRSVPEGKLIVSLAAAAPAKPPVDEVVNVVRYVVGANVAVVGAFVTLTPDTLCALLTVYWFEATALA